MAWAIMGRSVSCSPKRLNRVGSLGRRSTIQPREFWPMNPKEPILIQPCYGLRACSGRGKKCGNLAMGNANLNSCIQPFTYVAILGLLFTGGFWVSKLNRYAMGMGMGIGLGLGPAPRQAVFSPNPCESGCTQVAGAVPSGGHHPGDADLLDRAVGHLWRHLLQVCVPRASCLVACMGR
jgi:hypothetical protein